MTVKCIVVTSCTARKRNSGAAVKFSRRIVGASIRETAERWRQELQGGGPRTPDGQLYVGRSISEARWVANHLQAPMHVVSAGIGLIDAEEEVPPYDLTVAGRSSTFQRVLEEYRSTTTDWWLLLCKGRGFRDLLTRNPRSLVLVALPATYLEMISKDLSSCTAKQLERLRIFTSQHGRNALPASLAEVAMPYDDRLESLRGYSGTRADFPQRAMRHYVECLQAQRLTARNSSRAVEQALAPYTKPKLVKRRRVDDEVIKDLIRRRWSALGGRSAMLLRHLRDDRRVACEQARFAQLCRLVRQEKQR
jgi:hypothetical protein